MVQSHSRDIFGAYFVLLLAILACSISGEGSETIPEEPVLASPTQAAIEMDQAAPTLAPIPTFTPIVTTPEGIVQPTVATEGLASTEPTESGPSMEINPQDGAVVVNVPAGEFLMGSNAPGANQDERPAHTVHLDEFWLYQTTVTNRQYRQCINSGACDGTLGRHPETNLPAVNVSWFEAQTYCEWAGGQLPTEAQWEKGARGIDGRLFPWGDTPPTCDLANYKNCYGSKAIDVEDLLAGASPYGALHMAGNVWEWVWDWYDPGYYSVSPDSNPTGPVEVEEEFRVQRGGSFENDPSMLYASIRSRSGPAKTDYRKGFRCVIVE